jgi:hypothetical protein
MKIFSVTLTPELIRLVKVLHFLTLNAQFGLLLLLGCLSYYFVHPVLAIVVATHGISHIRRDWKERSAVERLIDKAYELQENGDAKA